MSNITISIDDDLLKKAKKIAVDRETSFNGLIRGYVEELVHKEEKRRQLQIEELDLIFSTSTAVVGEKYWSRDDLHER
jgi:predicted transcriptional regulator